ncbi:MAG TPA: hypothetical protein ENK91_02635 [Bacteroidetes bacterium]|nr:hypothetical protein [Bacteroidota bacterium]
MKTKEIPDKGTYTYTYNNQDQVETETLPNGNVLTYNYNNTYNDLIESVSMGSDILKTYTYDEVKGWQTSETLVLLGADGSITNTVSDFDDIGRVVKESKDFLNGAGTYSYKYDGADNMLFQKIEMTGPGAPVTMTKNYKYNHGVRLIKTQGEFPDSKTITSFKTIIMKKTLKSNARKFQNSFNFNNFAKTRDIVNRFAKKGSLKTVLLFVLMISGVVFYKVAVGDSIYTGKLIKSDVSANSQLK